MPRRKDRLPKDAINSQNSVLDNAMLAQDGPIWADRIAAFCYLYFIDEKDEAEVAEVLMPAVLAALRKRDAAAFTEIAESFALALKAAADGLPDEPFDRRMSLVCDYHIKEGDAATTPGLIAYLAKHRVRIDDSSQARSYRRRIGKGTEQKTKKAK